MLRRPSRKPVDNYKLKTLEEFKIHYYAKKEIAAWFAKTIAIKPHPKNSLLVVSGPPGVGKSTLVELVCLHFDYSPYIFDLCLFESREQLIVRLNALCGRTKDLEGTEFAVILESIDSLAPELVTAVTQILPKLQVPVIAICNNAYSPFPRSLCQKNKHIKMYPVSTDDMFQITLWIHEKFKEDMGRLVHEGDLVRTDVRHISVSAMGDIRRCFYLTTLTLATHTSNLKRMVSSGCSDRHLLNPFDVAKALFDPHGTLISRRNALDAAEDTGNLQLLFVHHNHPRVNPPPSLDTLADTAERLSMCDLMGIFAAEHSSLYMCSKDHTGEVDLEFPKQPHTDQKVGMIIDAMKETAVGMRYNRKSGLLLDVHQHLTGKGYTKAVGKDPARAAAYHATLSEFGLDSFRDKTTAELVLRKVQEEQQIKRAAAPTFKSADGDQYEALVMANLLSTDTGAPPAAASVRMTGKKRPAPPTGAAAPVGMVTREVVPPKAVAPAGAAAPAKKKVDKSRLPPVPFVSTFPLPEGMPIPKVQKQIGNYFKKKD